MSKVIGINLRHQPYLGFKFKNQSFTFLAMPFGLSTALRIFTRVMGNIMKALVREDIVAVIYLDDLLVIANSKAIILQQLVTTLKTLKDI